MFSGQERQLSLFGPAFELGGFLAVISFPALAISGLRIEGRSEALPFDPELLDLRGQVLAIRERLVELLEPSLLSGFEHGAFVPVLGLPRLAIRDLRVEGCGQTLPFGPMLFDLCGQPLLFRESPVELLVRLFRPSFLAFLAFLAFTGDPLALKRCLEPVRQRRVAEAEQERLDTIRVVVDRDALKKHGAIGAGRESQMVFGRRGAARPDLIGEFLPVSTVGRGQAVRQVGVQDSAERVDIEEAERRIIASEEQAVPAHANQAARLPLEELAEIGGIRQWKRRTCGRCYRRSACAQFTHTTQTNYT